MKLIVIDGVDSSGKETNTKYIYDLLSKRMENVSRISFPNYDSPSSSLVKMYLEGEFGDSPNDVSPYAASMFYAVDRYATFKKAYGYSFNKQNGIIVADRYVTSNMIHQAAKIKKPENKQKFLDWLYDLEYTKLQLPKPDLVIFLDMPVWAAEELMKSRKNKITNDDSKDIHEKNTEYLEESYNNAMLVAEKYNWHIVKCTEGDRIKSLEEIQSELREIVIPFCHLV